MRRFALALGLFSALAVPSACLASTITGVTFSGSAANPTITVTGSGFGTTPPATTSPSASGTGFDYGTSLFLNDNSQNPTAFSAGYQNMSTGQYDYVGLVLFSYTDNSIVYQLGSLYTNSAYPNGIYKLNAGDAFTAGVLGATYSGNVVYALAPTPEPSGLLLMATGLTGVAAAVRRRIRPRTVPCEG